MHIHSPLMNFISLCYRQDVQSQVAVNSALSATKVSRHLLPFYRWTHGIGREETSLASGDISARTCSRLETFSNFFCQRSELEVTSTSPVRN